MPEITQDLIDLQRAADAAIAATEGGGEGHIERTAEAARTVQKLYAALHKAVPAGSSEERLKFQNKLRAAARGE